MFLGTFEHTLDDKGRVILPAKFRAELGQGVVITQGLDRCLFLFPMDEWTPLAERISDLSLTDPKARNLRRLIFSEASDAVPDRQGRILIPARLREYANLNGQVVITGLNTYIEIWDTEAWHGVKVQAAEDIEKAEQWEDLGI
ncbi:MAG: division/cell wall cluster transcriptional repressor MraZ [Chloroflexota bacterium]|nr:division/cell wall cluster transcriptional repressor MraZ [Chloroflexota bacterium]